MHGQDELARQEICLGQARGVAAVPAHLQLGCIIVPVLRGHCHDYRDKALARAALRAHQLHSKDP